MILDLTLDSMIDSLFVFVYRTVKYNIGSYVFSLDDIYHGILRCNQTPPGMNISLFACLESLTKSRTYQWCTPTQIGFSVFKRQFMKSDPRCDFAVSPVDPRYVSFGCRWLDSHTYNPFRIHFLLGYGTRQSPVIYVLHPSSLQILNIASTQYFDSRVKVDVNSARISLPKKFRWFKKVLYPAITV